MNKYWFIAFAILTINLRAECLDTTIISEESLFELSRLLSGDVKQFMKDDEKDSIESLSPLKIKEWQKSEDYKSLRLKSKEYLKRVSKTCFQVDLEPKNGFAGASPQKSFGEYDVESGGFWITPEHMCYQNYDINEKLKGVIIGSVFFGDINSKLVPHPRKPYECGYQYILIQLPDSLAIKIEDSNGYKYSLIFEIDGFEYPDDENDYINEGKIYRLVMSKNWVINILNGSDVVYSLKQTQKQKKRPNRR